MELLLHDPSTISFVPVERMSGIAWYYFILDDRSNYAPIYEKIPWHLIPMSAREMFRRVRPEVVIPNCRDGSCLVQEDDGFVVRPLAIDPQVGVPIFRFVDYDDRRERIYAASVSDIIDSFKGRSRSGWFLVTSLGDWIAGFGEPQHSYMTPTLIHWSMRFGNKIFNLYFNRHEFEVDFACSLSRLLHKYRPRTKHPDDEDDYPDYLPSYEGLYEEVKSFAEYCPHCREYVSKALREARKSIRREQEG